MQKFWTKSRYLWEGALTSLWFVPAILVTMAIALSFILLFIDRTYAEFISTHLTWLFSGTPSSAQQILTSIAGAVITVVSISFSLTIIAMQQAAVQYTPRVLRNFTSDKGNQLILGFYIATFTYALLILRAIRTSEFENGGFVPSVSMGFAVLFALICMGLLVYFINHIASSLQASTITSQVHQELLKQIDNLYPENVGTVVRSREKQRLTPRKGKQYPIKSKMGGYITQIDEESINKINFYDAKELRICPKIGDFVYHGEVIAYLTMPGQLPKSLAEDIRGVITISLRRSTKQDPLFAIRQLVDTALKGLSPGINDITTSNYCIRYLGDALGVLAGKNFPSEERSLPEKKLLIRVERPTWADFVNSSFNEVLHNIKDNAQALDELLSALEHLAGQLPNNSLNKPVELMLNNLEMISKKHLILPSDKKMVTYKIKIIRNALAEVPTK